MKNKYKLLIISLAFCLVLQAQPGNALHFDGSNDFISVPSTTQNNLGAGDYTIELWLKTSFSGLGVMIGKYGGTGYWLGCNGGKISMSINGSVITSTANVNDNSWKHVAVRRLGTTTSIFINGVLDSSFGTLNGNPTNGDPLTIGNFIDSFHFPGAIDDVRIWNVARTDAQILNHKDTEISTAQPGLGMYFKLNEGVANGTNSGVTTAINSLSNGNGTLNNFALTGTSSNWVEGVVVAGVFSNNANLSGLTLSTGTLSPAFNTSVNTYAVEVENSISSITVTPTAEDANAIIAVNGNVLNSGTASAPINLSVGLNTITIVVTAEDGTTNTYTVLVTRQEQILAAGGDISYTGAYTIHTFKNTGASNFYAPVTTNVEVLVVAGGGSGGGTSGPTGGGHYNGGGGGAGGVLTNTAFPVVAGVPVAVNVGVGGASVTVGSGNNGGNSSFGNITATGGGGGGAYGTAGKNGGSGGGSGRDNGTFGLGISGQGRNGGTGDSGGGGGAGAPGTSSSGGNGIQSSITGVLTYYAGGGGPSTAGTPGGSGGLGGGGNGVNSFNYPTVIAGSGVPNTGGGGGAAGVGFPTGSGGSGVVIVKYLTGSSLTKVDASNLSISSGALTPAFSTNTMNYTTTGVSTTTSNVSITLTAVDPSNTLEVRVNNGSFSTLTNGVLSDPINLVFGDNIIEARVRATDGSTKSYRITINREAPPATHLNFDGVNDFVTLPNINPVGSGVAGQYTVETWVNLNQYTPGNNGTNLYADERNANRGIQLIVDGNGFISTYHPNVGKVTSSYQIPLNTWTHVAFSQTNTALNLYVNGVFVQQLLASPNLHIETNQPEYLGTFTTNNSNFERFLNGSLDEVRVWNYARTANQIQASRNCELQGNESGLLAYYRFNQGVSMSNNTAIPALTDATSNNNHATLNNFALNGTISNFLAGSPVVTGVALPSAPVVNNQQFVCNSNATVGDLIPAPSATINWYFSTNTSVLAANTPLVSGTYYVAAVNANGCESDRVAVTINANNTTEWTTSWSNGEPSFGKKVIISGTYSGVGFEACDLTVTATGVATITSGVLNVSGNISVSTGGVLTLNNGVYVLQDASAINSGNVTVKRNSANMVRLDYTGWSSPVTGQNLFDFTPQTLPNRFYQYNSVTNAYVSVPNVVTGSSGATFTTGNGYLLRAPNNWSSTNPTAYPGSFTGVLNNGNGYTPSASVGFTLVGNPYPSQIDALSFIADNASLGTSTLYFWSNTVAATGGSYAQNNYASFNSTGGTPAQPGGLVPDGTIQVGQGFFMNATSAGNVNFNNNQRTLTSDNQFFRSAHVHERHRIWLGLTSPNNLHNQILIGYVSGASNDMDSLYDGKLFGETSSVLYTTVESNKLAIQGRALPFIATDEVALGFKATTAGNYTISLNQMDGLFSGTQEVYLRDNVLNNVHNIKLNPYSFVSEVGEFANRFTILYQNSVLSVENPEFNEENVVVYTTENGIHVQAAQNIKSIVVFDTLGRVVMNTNNINATSTVLHMQNANAMYLIQITSDDNQTITKKIKQ